MRFIPAESVAESINARKSEVLDGTRNRRNFSPSYFHLKSCAGTTVRPQIAQIGLISIFLAGFDCNIV
ncbi:MAG: hypothetical protein WB930_16630 [Syntrophobacteraceae bacterium]